MFHGDHGIALHAVQGIRASSRFEGDVSCFFLICGRVLGYILELRQGWPFNPRVCSTKSGLLSSYEGHLRNLLEAWQGQREASLGEAGDSESLSSSHMDIGIPVNVQEESGIVSF